MIKFLVLLFFGLYPHLVLATKTAETDSHVYIVLYSTKEIKVIDRKTEGTHSIPLRHHPCSIAIHDQKAYVVFCRPYTILVIDLQTENEFAEIPINCEDEAKSLSFWNGKGYFVQSFGGAIGVIDLNKNVWIEHIFVGGCPSKMIIVDGEAWVTDRYRNLISVVDLGFGFISKKVQTKYSTKNIAAYGDSIYVSCAGSARVVVINKKYKNTKDIDVGHLPKKIKFYNNHAFISCIGGSQISIINCQNNKVVKTIYTGSSMKSMSIRGDFGYCTVDSHQLVFVIDLKSYKVVRHIKYQDHFKNSKLVLSDAAIYLTGCYLDRLSDQLDRLTIAELCHPFITYEPPVQLYDDGETQYKNLLNALEEGRLSDARYLYMDALYCNHPKVLAIAAFSYLAGKWGARTDILLFLEHYKLSDRDFFRLLCQRYG